VFYDRIGELLSRMGPAADSLDPATEQGTRQLRQLALAARRIDAIWSAGLFGALDQENVAMATTLEELTRRCDDFGVDTSTVPPVSADEPTARYRELVAALNGIVGLLDAHRGEAWVPEARLLLRAGLLRAAEAQGRLVDAAWAV
jgi:hypothetical protein